MFDTIVIILSTLLGLICFAWLADDSEIEILRRRQADIKARAKQILEENNRKRLK